MNGQSDMFGANPKPTEERIANQIVAVVSRYGMQGNRPDDWAKQHRAALRLVRTCQANAGKAEIAARGMAEACPWKKWWDVFDLEQAWSKALAAGQTIMRRERAIREDVQQAARAKAALRRGKTSVDRKTGEVVEQYPSAPVVDVEGLRKFARERERRGRPVPDEVQRALEKHNANDQEATNEEKGG